MIFIMLTRLIGKEVHPEKYSLETLNDDVKKRVAKECPELKWISHYALFGTHDYLDIFSAPDIESAMKVAVIVRSSGSASTEIWPALKWDAFKEVVSTLPKEKSFQ